MSYCKANALANDNDRDKISENQRQHRNGIDMHVLLAGNVPKLLITKENNKRQKDSTLLRLGVLCLEMAFDMPYMPIRE